MKIDRLLERKHTADCKRVRSKRAFGLNSIDKNKERRRKC